MLEKKNENKKESETTERTGSVINSEHNLRIRTDNLQGDRKICARLMTIHYRLLVVKTHVLSSRRIARSFMSRICDNDDML